MFRRMLQAVSGVTGRLRDEVGQTTAEYALVILGAAAVATLLITWATKSHAVGKLFDEVIGKVLQ
ncbi:MAG: DUF4244 domain-containing protein [Acidimicrobiia bacterium]